MIFEIADLDPKLNTWADGLKIAMCLIFINLKHANYESNMLIMNILIGIDDFDPKL